MQDDYTFTPGKIKVLGYQTERGLISVIKKLNQHCIKQGFNQEITIRLPIKRSHNHKI